MFFAGEVCCIADISSVNPSSEQAFYLTRANAIHQTSPSKSLPYQPLLIIAYLQLARQRRSNRDFSNYSSSALISFNFKILASVRNVSFTPNITAKIILMLSLEDQTTYVAYLQIHTFTFIT